MRQAWRQGVDNSAEHGSRIGQFLWAEVLVMLAGAGAGKTHELIERIAATVMSGKCEVDRLAAITFTRKAAGEMRGRLFVKLRKEADDTGARPGSPVRRALDKIDQFLLHALDLQGQAPFKPLLGRVRVLLHKVFHSIPPS